MGYDNSNVDEKFSLFWAFSIDVLYEGINFRFLSVCISGRKSLMMHKDVGPATDGKYKVALCTEAA